jgi:hypothetical protein
MPAMQLQELLWETDHPGVDLHAATQQFRALRTMNEQGRIPPDGLMRAQDHRKRMETDSDLFPAAPDLSPIVPSSGTIGLSAAGIQNSGWVWIGPGNM